MSKEFWRGLAFALPISILMWIIIIKVCFGATYYVDSVKGIDTATGDKQEAAVKSMIATDKFMISMKVGDSFTIIGTPIWGMQTGVDSEGQAIYDIEEGIIQYHYVPTGKIRTVIQVGKIILYGTSIVGEKGKIETMIEEVKPIEVEKEKIIK